MPVEYGPCFGKERRAAQVRSKPGPAGFFQSDPLFQQALETQKRVMLSVGPQVPYK